MIVGFGNGYAQNVSDSLLVEFFNKTFNDHFNHYAFSEYFNYYFLGQKKLMKDFYILKDSSMPEGVTTDYANFKFHFIDKPQAYPLIKKGEIVALFWAKSKHISVNTIDIVIGGCSVEFKNGEYFFGAWCGGTFGYVPQGRFIYDNASGEWKYFTSQDIIEEKIREEEEMIKKYREKTE